MGEMGEMAMLLQEVGIARAMLRRQVMVKWNWWLVGGQNTRQTRLIDGRTWTGVDGCGWMGHGFEFRNPNNPFENSNPRFSFLVSLSSLNGYWPRESGDCVMIVGKSSWGGRRAGTFVVGFIMQCVF